ncbi:MAG: lytic transglycosylase domain-containing protein, partial [Burkholderiaceae bacterium]
NAVTKLVLPPAAPPAAAADPDAPRHAALAEFLAKRYKVSQDVTLQFVQIAHAEAKRVNLDPLLIMAVIAVESRYNPIAESEVGAKGLMQIMPKTAKSVARDMGLKGFRLDRLEEPQTNISLGIHYLRDLTRDFKGSAILATAAYNAGPSRSRLWSGQLTQTIPGAAFAESIPFSETRGYVKQVLANTAVYQGLLRQSETSNLLNEWLAQIGPGSSRLAVNP